MRTFSLSSCNPSCEQRQILLVIDVAWEKTLGSTVECTLHVDASVSVPSLIHME